MAITRTAIKRTMAETTAIATRTITRETATIGDGGGVVEVSEVAKSGDVCEPSADGAGRERRHS
jgi:hypothetical protein